MAPHVPDDAEVFSAGREFGGTIAIEPANAETIVLATILVPPSPG
jgi:hypothetical protein